MIPCPAGALKTKRAFTDFCTCVLISSNGMKSRETTAEQIGFTVSRIDYAVKRGQAAGYIEKQQNIILAMSGDPDTLQRQRGRLLAVHGIATPPLFRYKRQYHLGLYASNNHKLVMAGQKGKRPYLKYDVTRYNLIDMLSETVRLFKFGIKYSFDQYLEDFGFQNV
jgi:hypothetical protein